MNHSMYEISNSMRNIYKHVANQMGIDKEIVVVNAPSLDSAAFVASSGLNILHEKVVVPSFSGYYIWILKKYGSLPEDQVFYDVDEGNEYKRRSNWQIIDKRPVPYENVYYIYNFRDASLNKQLYVFSPSRSKVVCFAVDDVVYVYETNTYFYEEALRFYKEIIETIGDVDAVAFYAHYLYNGYDKGRIFELLYDKFDARVVDALLAYTI